MRREWRRALPTCTTGFIGERTGRSRHGESTFRKPMGDSVHLGLAALVDKIVQQDVVEVLQQIYEEDLVSRTVSGRGATRRMRWIRSGTSGGSTRFGGKQRDIGCLRCGGAVSAAGGLLSAAPVFRQVSG